MLLLILAGLLALRIGWLILFPFPLYGDEAQYWTWAQDLAFGYYSKPPIVAWAIAFTTGLFGDAEWAVRLASPIVHSITALVMYAIGRVVANERAGFWCGVTYATLPAVSLSSTLISTDPFLLLFWALAMLGFIKALQMQSWRWWLFTGLVAGLGLMSKYSMAFFAFSALFYVLWQKPLRAQLFNCKLWVATGLAFLVWLPNVLWNARHDFVSFMHTQDNANLGGPLFHPDELLEFLGAQLGVFGPVGFVLLLYVMVKSWRNPDTKLFIAFIVPMLLSISVISLLSRAHGNWAAPVYIAGTVLIVYWCVQQGKIHWLKINLGVHVVALVVFLLSPWILAATGLAHDADTDPFKRLRGWRAFAGQMLTAQQYYPEAYIVSDERQVIASLTYYLRDKDYPKPIYKWPMGEKIHDHYDLMTDMGERKGEDFLMVSRTRQPEGFFTYFEKSGSLPSIRVSTHDDRDIEYQLYYLENYKGH